MVLEGGRRKPSTYLSQWFQGQGSDGSSCWMVWAANRSLGICWLEGLCALVKGLQGKVLISPGVYRAKVLMVEAVPKPLILRSFIDIFSFGVCSFIAVCKNTCVLVSP